VTVTNPPESSQSPVRVAIHGAAGRMGRQLLSAANERADVRIGAAIELPGTSAVGANIELLCADIPNTDDNNIVVVDTITTVSNDFDVLIDFTRPESSLQVLDILLQQKKPMVIGTTGFDEKQKRQLQDAAKHVPILLAPNFSVGVTLALNIAAITASALGDDYDIEIIEAHHRNKVDAPSGTALALGESVATAVGRDLNNCAIYGREGNTGIRERETIGFETIRGGDIIGDHTVLFAGQGERLEITHKATDRMTFARGAVRAAVWLATRSPGYYDMTDVLGLSARAT